MKIFAWSFHDERRWLALWCAGIGTVICFVVVLYPSFGELVRAFVEKTTMIKAFMGRYAPLMKGRSYYDLWLSLEFFPTFGMFVGFYPILYATSSVSGEFERGTLGLLLAQPVSRTRVITEKFAALALGLLVLCTVSFLTLAAATAIWVEEEAALDLYGCVFVNNYFFLLAVGAFGFLCAVVMGGQRAALSVGIGALVLGALLYKGLTGAGLAPWATRLTPYYYADATKILTTGRLSWADNLVLAVAGACLLGAAVFFFRRKDVTT